MATSCCRILLSLATLLSTVKQGTCSTKLVGDGTTGIDVLIHLTLGNRGGDSHRALSHTDATHH